MLARRASPTSNQFIFVVGAPRCGTTTLSRFLKEHPAINFPALKEPHYFALNDLRGLSDEELRERVEGEFLDASSAISRRVASEPIAR